MKKRKSIIDFSVGVGDLYYPTTKSFLIILEDKVLLLSANSLKEANEYLEIEFTDDIKSPFAIIDVTYSTFKITLQDEFTENLIGNIRSLFSVTLLE